MVHARELRLLREKPVRVERLRTRHRELPDRAHPEDGKN